MKWRSVIVLATVLIATLSGLEAVSGLECEWEHEFYSDVTALSVSDDGHVAALVSTRLVSDVYLLDKEGKLLWDREFEHYMERLTISQNASLVIVDQRVYKENRDIGVCYFLSNGGELLVEYELEPYTESSLFCSPNGEYLAIATSYYEYAPKDITLLDSDTGELLWRLSGVGELFTDMSVSAEGDVVICAGHTTYFLKDGKISWEHEIKVYEDFVDVAISPDGEYVVISVSGVKGDSIHTFDRNGNLINQKSVDSAPTILSISNIGTYTVISEDRIKSYSINNTLTEERPISKPRDAVLSPNARYAASTSQGKIFFYCFPDVTTVLKENAPIISEISASTKDKLELWNSTCDAIDNVTTVKYDQDLISHTPFDVYENFKTEVNFTAQKSYTVMTGTIEGEVYINGTIEYSRGPGGPWNVSEERWEWSGKKKVEELVNIKLPAEGKKLFEGELNGEDCWVMEIEEANVPGAKLTTKVWVAKEDYLPRLSVKEIREESSGIVDTTTTRYYDYNKALIISEPPNLPKVTFLEYHPRTPCFEFIFTIAGLLTVVYLKRINIID